MLLLLDGFSLSRVQGSNEFQNKYFCLIRSQKLVVMTLFDFKNFFLFSTEITRKVKKKLIEEKIKIMALRKMIFFNLNNLPKTFSIAGTRRQNDVVTTLF